ncbi:hypothetical protein, partial [Burkholderia sp. SIMBA_024]|uniref:hypothetical protein n=1 Tax=Burkholderia sp. SIMBA_024 TaxID=3085768 RepID=UPI0039780D31
RQMLSRLRDNTPIHLFLKKIGNGKLDGGETEVNEVLRSNKARTKQNLSNLRKLKHYDIEFGNNSQHDYAYAQCIATHNLGLSAYREIVLEGLRREGYDIEHME